MNDLPPPMRTVWHSLLWKEWHEHKWKLAALLSISVPLLIELGFFADFTVFVLIIMLIPIACGSLSGIFLGMSTAGGENARKTMPFLQSLPVPMWQPALVKLTMAVFTAAFPLLVFFGVSALFYVFFWHEEPAMEPMQRQLESLRGWGISNWVLAGIVGTTLGVASLTLWMAALGVNRSDEIRAGAIGFSVICIVWIALAVSYEEAQKNMLPAVADGIEVLFAAAPGGAAFVDVWDEFIEGSSWWAHFQPFVTSAVVGHGCLLAWYLRRFGKVAPGSSRTDGKTLSLGTAGYQHLAPPMRSQLMAIAWKQLRETGPIALTAVGGILAVATGAWIYDSGPMSAINFGDFVLAITPMVCLFVTLVTGIGIFLEDLKPRVDDFWRSRPVNYQLWFVVKFVVGATVLAFAFGVLMLIAYCLSDGNMFRNELRGLESTGLFLGISLVFLLIYTLSMAIYCVLRQPLYAAVLTLGLLSCGTFLQVMADRYLFNEMMPWQVGLALLLLCQVAATVLAWQAVKRNWHWAGR